MTSTTSTYSLDAHFKYTLNDDEGDGHIVAFLDAVEEHLESLGVEDILIVADEDDQEFTLSQLVLSPTGESIETVVGKGMGTMRTAFHACNAATPSWPSLREVLMYVNVSVVEGLAEDAIGGLPEGGTASRPELIDA